MRAVAELEERRSQPREALVADLRKPDGDILALGADGKLGPGLVRLALRGVAAAETGAYPAEIAGRTATSKTDDPLGQALEEQA
ncbi:hypothetical protein [Micromonospora sp. DT47]|uniref:hypothetical protein n=1 Tax=Micromonospora sp. DT47 TaxID=3393431 RepID=UPI003CE7DB3B